MTSIRDMNSMFNDDDDNASNTTPDLDDQEEDNGEGVFTRTVKKS